VSVMRMPYWVSALAVAGLLAAAPQGQLALPSGGSVTYSAAGSKTRFEIRMKSGRRYEVNVERDSMVSQKAQPATAQLVAEVADKALILTDTYPSVPLGLSYCQAGEERFLRVITLADGRAREALRLKLASCRDNIELADPGFEWNGDSGTLRLHWLQGPANKGKPEERTIHIGADGKPF
jgi:hypothetical protein